MRVLVTGGSGYFGKSLVRALLGAGMRPRLFVRDPGRLGGLDLGKVEVAVGDLLYRSSLRRALEGCEAVFHAAALVKRWVPDRRAFDRVNVEGTEALIREAGARRIVYTSSFFALGCSDDGPGGVIDEDHRRDPEHWHTDYERTKALADVRVRALASEGAPVVTLYPAVLYGPGDMTEGNIVGRLVLDFAAGRLPGIPCRGDRKWGYAFVEDVAGGHLLAFEKGKPGDRFILGGENCTADRFFEVLAGVLGRRPPRLHLPYGLVWSAALFQEVLARLFARDPRLTRAEAATYRHHWAYDDSRARKELGYRGRPLEEGLRATVEALLPKR
ncbi:MAG TPA: NAD-dependent epimerase/dehydratase family protein [Planctomycetota bacterium]|nr:NAD-dependent epimerase/dehydratase family protein [Planctomycetota bacterium]